MKCPELTKVPNPRRLPEMPTPETPWSAQPPEGGDVRRKMVCLSSRPHPGPSASPLSRRAARPHPAACLRKTLAEPTRDHNPQKPKEPAEPPPKTDPQSSMDQSQAQGSANGPCSITGGQAPEHYSGIFAQASKPLEPGAALVPPPKRTWHYFGVTGSDAPQAAQRTMSKQAEATCTHEGNPSTAQGSRALRRCPNMRYREGA